jgi:hypothetical protein
MTSQPAFSHEESESRNPGRSKSDRGPIRPIDALSLSEIDTFSASAEDVDETWRRLLFFQAINSDGPGLVRGEEDDVGESSQSDMHAEAPDDLSDEAELAGDGAGEPRDAGDEEDAGGAIEQPPGPPRPVGQDEPSGEPDRDRAVASALLQEAGETREKVVSEAQGQAIEIMTQARDAVSKEATEMRRQVLAEVKQALTRIEALAAETVQTALAEATKPVEAAPISDTIRPINAGATVKASTGRKKKNENN